MQFVFRQFGCILLLVFRRATAVPQRLVPAISSGMIANKEVRSELRGREIEGTTNYAVAHDDRQDHYRNTQDEERGWFHTEAKNGPAEDYGNEDNRVLARQ